MEHPIEGPMVLLATGRSVLVGRPNRGHALGLQLGSARADHAREGGRVARRASLIVVMVAVMDLGSPWLWPALAAPAPSDVKPSGQWSMFMNGPQRRGITPIVGAQTSALAWRIEASINGGGATVGRDGTVYLGTFDGHLLAIRRNGTLKWALPITASVNATPAILLDGRIAFVDEGGAVSVVNPDGSFSWKYETGTGFSSPSGAT